ncbi:MAG: hypothetical protein V1862_00825 [Methanobacteriota archaeon]
MNHFLSLGFISSLLLVSLAGICVADNAPGYLVYIQGGESSIMNGSDGAYVITVKDIVPYFHTTNGVINSLIPVERLNNPTSPLNAALVFSDKGNESTVMVRVTNISLSDGNKVLTLQADPLEYYDGELLKSLYDRSRSLEMLIGSTLPNLG